MMIQLRLRDTFAAACRIVVVAVLACGSTDIRAEGLPKVPEGFEARLVATVPAVHFPSQVATAPGGLLFVAEDPMDQIGPVDQPIDRILLFREGKEPVVFADKLNAIFGMAYREGALYVMNMPHLTILRDRDGDGRAEERTELFTDLGVPAGSPNKLNDHIVSGLQFGVDGWLYISVGDKGVPLVKGPDGRTVTLMGGGVLRCRPDGTGIEVFSSGTRNHLEPNLDAQDHLFTYDNTDDGDGWWTRVTYHIQTGYYGYPYDYHKFTHRMIPRIAEYGGGSPCGGVVYNEDAWPEKFQGRAFWAEWGKRHIASVAFKPKGAGFEIADYLEFATPVDSNEFRPLDLALSYDGKTLYVADWEMGGWGTKDEKVGRVYAITCTNPRKTKPRGSDSDPIEAQIKALDHPSLNERTRAQLALIRMGKRAIGPVSAALTDPKTPPVAARHLIWTLDGIVGGTPEATQPIMNMLASSVPDVRAQAARALGDRQAAIAEDALRKLLKDPEPAVRLQAVVALGKIGNPASVRDLAPILAADDVYLAFAARQAVRRIADWKAIGSVFSNTKDAKMRNAILETLELVYELDAAKILAKAALGESKSHPDEQAMALTYLAAEHRKTKPWDGKWWGTRPSGGGPPAKDVDWPGTVLVANTLKASLKESNPKVRLAAVDGIVVSGEKSALPILRKMFSSESDTDVKTAIALALGRFKDPSSASTLVGALKDAKVPDKVRDAAIESLEMLGGEVASKALADLLSHNSLPSERQPKVIFALAKLKAPGAAGVIRAKLKSPAPAVRAAAAEALGNLGENKENAREVAKLIADPDLEVRKAAVKASGELSNSEATTAPIAAAEKPETAFEATLALAKMPNLKALPVYLRGLASKSQDERKACASAVAAIRDQAAPILEELSKRRELSGSIVPELKTVFQDLQPIVAWKIAGPVEIESQTPKLTIGAPNLNQPLQGKNGKSVAWKAIKANPATGEVNLGRRLHDGGNQTAFGYAEIQSTLARTAKMAVGSDDTLTVWVNGKQVYDFKGDRGFSPAEDQIDVELASGTNHVLIKCSNHGGGWSFSVAAASGVDYAFLKAPSGAGFNPDAYREFALKTKGNADHGKALFSDLKGLACLKCHAVGSQGGKVGPELSGVGAKYLKPELVESVLYPSSKISSGYEPLVLATSDGRVVTGIVKRETPTEIEIEDAEAKRVTIKKDDIEEKKPSSVSLMPNGLAEGLSQTDFADLIAYLETLKETKPGPTR